MSEPAAPPVRSQGTMKHIVWALAGAAALAAAGLGWLAIRTPAEPTERSTKPGADAVAPACDPAVHRQVSVTARSQPTFHPWPTKPEVIGPPADALSPAAPIRKNTRPASLPTVAEPKAPTSDELKKESSRTGDEMTAEAAKEVLLDDKKSSAVKLAVIDKLRGQDPAEVVPVLVAFLEAPASDAARYTKPTAVKVLSDLRDPRAEEALARLAQTSADERVRLTIMALQAKERSR